jgi:uncharacterized protein Yka (UPF0111/DUF47 family)
MALAALLRSFLPKEDRYFELLERQAHLACEAARQLSQRPGARLADEGSRSRIEELEHAGDGEVHTMVDWLARSFVTPVDREDLQRLSYELDAVLDVTNLVARCSVLFGLPRATPPMVELVGKLVECTEHLAVAVRHLHRNELDALMGEAHTIHELEEGADRIFRGAVSTLFHDGGVDPKDLIRDKEILGYLEHAIDECDHVATTLRNLAAKHS